MRDSMTSDAPDPKALSAAELLPCPFCGAKAEKRDFRVVCGGCGACSGYGAVPVEFVSAWNARAAAPSPPAPDGGLREKIRATVAPLIAADLEKSIASLGYAVGMGQAPHPDVCLFAANRILDSISETALAALAESKTGEAGL